MKPIFTSEINIAIQAAIDASFLVMKYYVNGFNKVDKIDGSPVTEADKASSDLIHERLSQTGIPIIGEEIKNQPYSIRKDWELNWCVDPLDGTKEFIKKNDEFAINIALVNNQKPEFGIIVSPVEKKILVGGKKYGCFVSSFSSEGHIDAWVEIEQKKEINNPIVLISSRSFHSSRTEDFVNELRKKFGELAFTQKGSALKFFDLAFGKADIYPRVAPTMEWDIAAGQAILESLGGVVLELSTNLPLVYNKEDLLNPFFVAFSSVIKEKRKL